MTLAKHLGGGVPISAVITSAVIEDTVVSQGFVYGHSNNSDPLQALAAIAAIELIEEESLIDRAVQIGARLRHILDELRSRHELIGDVRGRGLLHGIELVEARETRKPARDAGAFIESFCLDNGLMVSLRGGDLGRNAGNIIRMVPPFTTTDEELGLAGEILDAGLTQARNLPAA
jgi:2,2-dialkylglycine decarboxylase (pyruvate)